MKNKVLNRRLLLFTTLKDEQRPSPGQKHHRSNSAAVKSPWLQKTSVLTAPESYFRFDLTRLNKTGSLLRKKKGKKGKKKKPLCGLLRKQQHHLRRHKFRIPQGRAPPQQGSWQR